MLSRFGGQRNLVEDGGFWAAVLETYRGGVVKLPIEATPAHIRDLADLIHCPQGCGSCCRHYKRVGVTAHDIHRLQAAGKDPTPWLVEHEGTQHLNIEGGCHFLEAGTYLCNIYAHRPDGCYFHPLQLSYNESEPGKPRDLRMHVRIECSVVVEAIRQLYRWIIQDNPDLELQADLRFKQREAANV